MSWLLAICLCAVAFVHPDAPPKPVANKTIWQRIAVCESTSRWHLVDGIYRGGLQFTSSSWLSMGGGEFAPTADRATERQQMVVANRLLRAQGYGAWPVCSVVAGVR